MIKVGTYNRLVEQCPKCGHEIDYLLHSNEDDQYCPYCGVLIHWQGSSPWCEGIIK